VKHPFLRRYPSFTAVHFWMLWCSEWARIGIEHAHRAGVLDEDGAIERELGTNDGVVEYARECPREGRGPA
jgi:hypothetical protein